MIEIITKRLILRDHTPGDLQGYHKWISDPVVMKYVVGFPRTNSIQESFVSLADAINGSLESPRKKYFLAITLKLFLKRIGNCLKMSIVTAGVDLLACIRTAGFMELLLVDKAV